MSTSEHSGRVFVGRERELAELRAAVGGMFAGQGGLFLLVGDAGIGKTRLAEEAGAGAGAAGATVVWGHCWEGGGAPAYWVWVQVLRRLFALAPLFTPDAAGVDLLQMLSGTGPPSPASASPDARFALFDAVHQILQKVAAAQPLVLVLDDLHEADESSLLLLHFVARELRSSPVVVLGTYREVELRRDPERARALSAAARFGKRIPLGGLTAADVAYFVEQTFALTPSPALLAAIHQTTEGNPFFVDEVVRNLLAESGSALPDRVPAGGLSIPPGVRDALRQRFRPLSPACRRVLDVAAVAGRELDVACLAELSGVPARALLDLLREAQDAGVVAEGRGAAGQHSFTHALIRETLYDDLAPAQRAELHARAGEVLERMQATDPERRLAEVADHFFHSLPGGDAWRAAHFGGLAGQRAAVALAYEDAATWYRRALQALAGAGDPDRVMALELLLALGDVQAHAPGAGGSHGTFEQAVELARTLDQPAAFARAVLGLADRGLGGSIGPADPVVLDRLEEALQRTAETDTVLRVRLLARLASDLCLANDRNRAMVLGDEAVEMARRLGDASALAHALSARHFVLWRRNDPADRLPLATQIVETAEAAGERELVAQGRTWKIIDRINAGDARGLDAEIESYARFASELRHPRYLWFTANFLALRALWLGRWDEGERQAGVAIELGERTGDRQALWAASVQIFVARREQGRLAEEEDRARLAVEQVPTSPVPRTLLALLYCELGRAAEARAELDRLATDDFGDLRRDYRIGVLPYLCEVCNVLEDRPRAALLYDLVSPFASSVLSVGSTVCLGAASLYLGLLSATLGRPERALAELEDALARHTAMGAEPLLARTQVACARVLLARGDRRRADLLLKDAARITVALGMRALGEQVAALQGDAEAEDYAQAAGDRGATVIPLRSVGREVASGGRPVARNGIHSAPRGETFFRLDGEFWTIGSGSAVQRLKDSLGLGYLARLLRHPGCELHVTELVSGDSGAPSLPNALREAGMTARRGQSDPASPITDTRARADYRGRVDDLRQELEEAIAFNDIGRAARLREQIDFLSRELAGRFAGPQRSREHERARVSVTRVIRAAIKRIGQRDPALGLLLRTTIKTGAFCSYTPDPRFPITWIL